MGDENACPCLNITKSEIAFLKKVDVQLIKNSRCYDIDIFFGVFNTLAIYTNGFLLAYNPQFLSRLTPNSYLHFKRYQSPGVEIVLVMPRLDDN